MDPDIAIFPIHREKGYVLGIILGFEEKNQYFIFGTNPAPMTLDEAKEELSQYIDKNIYWLVQRQ